MGRYANKVPIDSEIETSNSASQQRLRHRVELQSMQIEQILAKHQVDAEVKGGSIHSGWIDFDIQEQLADGWQKFRRLTDDLVTYLNVPAVKIERKNGSLKIFVKKEVPHAVDLLDLNDGIPEISGVGVTLGISENGQPILLNLSSPDVSNLLVTGIEGAGKSGLLRTVAISLALSNRQSEVQIGVISAGDGSRSIVTKANPLYPMNYLPHLIFPVVTSVQDAISALEFLVEEINYRLEINLNSPLLILLIDDVDWLLYKGGQTVYELLAELLHAPADAGLRTIISATDINLDGLSRLLKHDAPMRFVGRVENADQAFYLTGELDTGAEFLIGQGDFLAVTYGNQIRFQAAYIDDYDLHLTLSKLYRPSKGVLLARQKHGNRLSGIAEEDNTQVKFSYDSYNGRATIEDQTQNNSHQAAAVILEQTRSERHIDQEVDDRSSLSPRSKAMNIKEYEFELPFLNNQAGETSDELPGFLSAKSTSQSDEGISEPVQNPELGDKGQKELEYSDLEEDIYFDIDEDDEWQSQNRNDSNDSVVDSKRFH